MDVRQSECGTGAKSAIYDFIVLEQLISIVGNKRKHTAHDRSYCINYGTL